MTCRVNVEGETGGHVFISYQWDSKKTVLRVRDRLRSAGYRVWIDEDDICKLSIKLAFDDADTDADFLARILADTCD